MAAASWPTRAAVMARRSTANQRLQIWEWRLSEVWGVREERKAGASSTCCDTFGRTTLHGGSGESRRVGIRLDVSFAGVLSAGDTVSAEQREGCCAGAAGGRLGRAERCRVRVQPRGGVDWLRPAPGAAARPALQADVGLAVSASALQRRGRGRSGSSCSSAQLARQVLVKMPAWREREETGGEMGHWCFWQSGMWGPGLLGSPLRKVEKKERRGDFPENFGES
uniref:Uncharacterized protein n=1 Tax=Oryza glumipatula TaxID=40148 RepID=A0A0E0BR98_9ORYZ